MNPFIANNVAKATYILNFSATSWSSDTGHIQCRNSHLLVYQSLLVIGFENN